MIEETLQKYGFADSYLNFKNISYYISTEDQHRRLAIVVKHEQISKYYDKIIEQYKINQNLLGNMGIIDSAIDKNRAILIVNAVDLDPLYTVAKKESLISGNRFIPSIYEITNVICNELNNIKLNYIHYKLLFVNSRTHDLQYCSINDVLCHIIPDVEDIFGEDEFMIYRSPEELNGLPATNKSLLYKYGMMLYQIFTEGRNPFSSVTKETIIEEVRTETYIRPNYYNVSINSSIRNVIQKNLSIDPENRIETLDELLSIIDDINRGFLYHNEFDPSDEKLVQDDYKNKLVSKIVLDVFIVILIIGGISLFVIKLGNLSETPKIEYTVTDDTNDETYVPKINESANVPSNRQQFKKFNKANLDKLINKDMEYVSEYLKQNGIYIKKIDYERKGTNRDHKLLDFIFTPENKSIILTFAQKGFNMPDYQDNFYNAVKSDFTKRKLRIGNVSYIWTSQDKADRVLKTYPPAGTFIYENDSVNVVVGKGENVR